MHGPTLAAGGFDAASAAFVVPVVVVGIIVFVGVVGAVTAVALTSDTIRDELTDFFDLVAAEPECAAGPLPPWVTRVSDSDEALSPRSDARLHVCGEDDGGSLRVKVANNRNFGTELQASAGDERVSLVKSAAQWGLTLASAIRDTGRPAATIRVDTGPIEADLDALNPALNGGGIVSVFNAGECILSGGAMLCTHHTGEPLSPFGLVTLRPAEPQSLRAIHRGCGIKTNGAIACHNHLTSSTRFSYPSDDPRQFTAVSGSCGLRADGTVECWGPGYRDPFGSRRR